MRANLFPQMLPKWSPSLRAVRTIDFLTWSNNSEHTHIWPKPEARLLVWPHVFFQLFARQWIFVCRLFVIHFCAFSGPFANNVNGVAFFPAFPLMLGGEVGMDPTGTGSPPAHWAPPALPPPQTQPPHSGQLPHSGQPRNRPLNFDLPPPQQNLFVNNRDYLGEFLSVWLFIIFLSITVDCFFCRQWFFNVGWSWERYESWSVGPTNSTPAASQSTAYITCTAKQQVPLMANQVHGSSYWLSVFFF